MIRILSIDRCYPKNILKIIFFVFFIFFLVLTSENIEKNRSSAWAQLSFTPKNSSKTEKESLKTKLVQSDSSETGIKISDRTKQPEKTKSTEQPKITKKVEKTEEDSQGSFSFGTVSQSAEEQADKDEYGPKLGVGKTQRWKAGMLIQGGNAVCKNVFGTAPIPAEFPEQQVRIIEESFPKGAKVGYRVPREGNARQMIFEMSKLPAGSRFDALVTLEVTRNQLLAPTETSGYRIPKQISSVRQYLADSPGIEASSVKIKKVANEIVDGIDSDWEKVVAIADFVRKNVHYDESQKAHGIKGALAALADRDGDCEDMTALFIALCRSQKIPARTVWVPGHVYAEFYLEQTENDKGYWFPAQIAGTEKIGGIQETRLILQKGDCFKLPESPREKTRFLKETFQGETSGNDPSCKFVREHITE